ncbi:MAG: hypothetical protein LBR39_02595 [Coriobacteriales bacterium]|jgi:hypothetical protein|nr:hypothetical protein [Coriobacteriales bacterium]
MGLFKALFGGGSKGSGANQCPYFRGSFCGIAAASAVSAKCTNGRYDDCYYFQTRFSRSESFGEGKF